MARVSGARSERTRLRPSRLKPMQTPKWAIECVAARVALLAPQDHMHAQTGILAGKQSNLLLPGFIFTHRFLASILEFRLRAIESQYLVVAGRNLCQRKSSIRRSPCLPELARAVRRWDKINMRRLSGGSA